MKRFIIWTSYLQSVHFNKVTFIEIYHTICITICHKSPQISCSFFDGRCTFRELISLKKLFQNSRPNSNLHSPHSIHGIQRIGTCKHSVWCYGHLPSTKKYRWNKLGQNRLLVHVLQPSTRHIDL